MASKGRTKQSSSTSRFIAPIEYEKDLYPVLDQNYVRVVNNIVFQAKRECLVDGIFTQEVYCARFTEDSVSAFVEANLDLRGAFDEKAAIEKMFSELRRVSTEQKTLFLAAHLQFFAERVEKLLLWNNAIGPNMWVDWFYLFLFTCCQIPYLHSDYSQSSFTHLKSTVHRNE
jgi:hypothetical protein